MSLIGISHVLDQDQLRVKNSLFPFQYTNIQGDPKLPSVSDLCQVQYSEASIRCVKLDMGVPMRICR